MSKSDITIACTSCGRFKLLKRTITSLEKNVDITGCKKIMTEDSKDIRHIEKIKKAQENGFLKGWNIIFTGGSNKKNPYQSHYQALKTLYDNIDTEYTFHLEDDWLFQKKYPKLLEECVDILNIDKHIGIVCFTDIFHKDIYNFLQSKKEIKEKRFLKDLYEVNYKKYLQYKPYSEQSEDFTLNPGLRRTKEMIGIMFNHEDYVNEYNVGIRYKKLGLITIGIPICYHIGGGFNGTAFFKDGFLKSLFRALKNAIYHYIHTLKGKFNH